MSDDPKRRDRLSAALRENLKRRKAQARGRAEEARETPAAPREPDVAPDDGTGVEGENA
ncbi:hypothetical protein [Bradyrhizobium sp. 2TAF24]|uniref:hypothetical protein n=1 Tax=Bradyrhizobium sp. 2TAF24 TaxID=3233011 RepID=UPI003F8EFF2A